MEKLKKRWQISSSWQVLVILVVFGITGSSSVYIATPALEFIGLARADFSSDFFFGGLSYHLLRFIAIFPIYQVLLVSYGWLFGQYRFFWNFEKNMFARMGFSKIMK